MSALNFYCCLTSIRNQNPDLKYDDQPTCHSLFMCVVVGEGGLAGWRGGSGDGQGGGVLCSPRLD